MLYNTDSIMVNLDLAHEYFDQVGQEVDYSDSQKKVKRNPDKFVSLEEADAVQEIITCQISAILFHNTSGCDQTQRDTMVAVRRRLITAYEEKYAKEYIEYNEY